MFTSPIIGFNVVANQCIHLFYIFHELNCISFNFNSFLLFNLMLCRLHKLKIRGCLHLKVFSITGQSFLFFIEPKSREKHICIKLGVISVEKVIQRHYPYVFKDTHYRHQHLPTNISEGSERVWTICYCLRGYYSRVSQSQKL